MKELINWLLDNPGAMLHSKTIEGKIALCVTDPLKGYYCACLLPTPVDDSTYQRFIHPMIAAMITEKSKIREDEELAEFVIEANEQQLGSM